MTWPERLSGGYVRTIDYGDTADKVHLKAGPWHEAVLSGTNYSQSESGDKAIYERVRGVGIATYVDFSMLMKSGQRWGLKAMSLSQNAYPDAGRGECCCGRKTRHRRDQNVEERRPDRSLFNERHKVLIQAKG